MKTIEINQANDTLAYYTDNVKKESIIITDHGKPIAALFSLYKADMETVSLSTNPDFIKIIQKSRKSINEKGGILSKDLRKQLNL